ncbi:MAG: lamin tail domain-containing protein [Kofleriaceae bacterium]
MRALLLTLAACSNAADPVTLDANHHVDAALADAHPDGPKVYMDAPPPQIRLLVVNEVVASGNPDWVEIVNATTSPIEMSDFEIIDKAGDLADAYTFPAQTLGPGAFTTIDCDGTIVPFKLSADEEVWIYRKSDGALSDGVDWNDGDSPSGGSFARVPDTFAPFVTSMHPTKGTPNEL